MSSNDISTIVSDINTGLDALLKAFEAKPSVTVGGVSSMEVTNLVANAIRQDGNSVRDAVLNAVDAKIDAVVTDRLTDIDWSEHLDTRDIARAIDRSDIVSEIDLSDLASNIDLSDLASHIETDDIAEAVKDSIDVSDIASEIDSDDLASSLAANDAFVAAIAREIIRQMTATKVA